MTHDEVIAHAPLAQEQLNGKRIVTIGGGTGPFAVLSSLKHYPCDITAVVTMSDSGGSSRRLMDEFGQLPFGDLRQALVALSRPDQLWRDVFTFRFEPDHGRKGPKGHVASFRTAEQSALDAHQERRREVAQRAGVTGHSLGNLIISALEELSGGDLLQAIARAQELLETRGRVLPVTLAHATLCARLENGEEICGETDIDTRGEKDLGPLSPITEIYLHAPAPACEEAVEAISQADTIILGPGDLYTSILPNLLVGGIAEAIRASHAEKIYVCNLMTKHGETDGYGAADFVQRIHHYLGGPVDRVILHDGSFTSDVLEAYAAQQQFPVQAEPERVRKLGPKIVVAPMSAPQAGNYVRHDPDLLLRAIFAPDNP